MEKLVVDQEALTETLKAIVHQYGIDRVEKALLEIRKPVDGDSRQSNPSFKRSKPRSKQNTSQMRQVKNSASVFVSKLEVSMEAKFLLDELAKRYEKKEFLPTVGELRNFFEIHRIDAPASFSRVAAIPHVFKFLSQLEFPQLQSMLQTNSFSGPAQLGPIAEAIRSFSRHGGNEDSDVDETDSAVWEKKATKAEQLSNP